MLRAKTRTVLRVENTPEGRTFLRMLKSALPRGTRIKVRGRGSRAKFEQRDGREYGAYLPLKLATHFVAYIQIGGPKQ